MKVCRVHLDNLVVSKNYTMDDLQNVYGGPIESRMDYDESPARRTIIKSIADQITDMSCTDFGSVREACRDDLVKIFTKRYVEEYKGVEGFIEGSDEYNCEQIIDGQLDLDGNLTIL